MDAPVNVLSDTYNVWVPIEDTDLLKSITVDENGDWIVQGVMTSDDKDEEDDSITPDGMDCSYFLTKGWIKYEHGNNPNQFIGEPLEVKVGRFDHPTLRKAVNGIFVKGRLFQNRELAKQAVTAILDLQKSHSKRVMGWSIEGNVKERDRSTGKILKSVLRNVVLTMNPVNTMTWAELAKSFAKNHEVEVNMVDKSLDTGAMAEVMPQSVEGTPHDAQDPQDEWIRLFRKFVRETALSKSLRKSFVSSTPGEIGMLAYTLARKDGKEYDGALEFATYVSGKAELLKSMIGKIGGERMSKELAQALDTDLEELRKSLEADDEEEYENGDEGNDDDELEKSIDNDDEGDDEGNDEGDEGDDDGEDEGDDEGDEDEEDDEDDEGDEPVQKSMRTDFAKSLGKTQHQALDVSGFLADIADEIGFSIDGFNKSLSHVAKQQAAVVNVLSQMGELVKSLSNELTEVRADNAELQKSLTEVLQRPVGRKSVVNQREVQTITKSMGAGNGEKPLLTRGKVLDVLQKSFEAGNMALGKEIMRFEGGTPVDMLNLPSEVKTQLGM